MELSGLDDLAAQFKNAGLSVPPIPATLRPGVIRGGDWSWGTRPMDRDAMYLFDRYPAEALTGPVEDYVAISHGGHGLNSYAITYHLVYGPLALFAQSPWGGAYMNPAERVQELERQFAGIASVIEAADHSRAVPVRLLVLVSPFRGVGICSWISDEVRHALAGPASNADDNPDDSPFSRESTGVNAWLQAQASSPHDALTRAVAELSRVGGGAR